MSASAARPRRGTRLVFHLLALILVGLYAACLALLLFLAGISYPVTALVPIPLLLALAMLSQRISVWWALLLAIPVTAGLVAGRVALDLWLHGG